LVQLKVVVELEIEQVFAGPENPEPADDGMLLEQADGARVRRL
jgi:hypothetical protein